MQVGGDDVDDACWKVLVRRENQMAHAGVQKGHGKQ